MEWREGLEGEVGELTEVPDVPELPGGEVRVGVEGLLGPIDASMARFVRTVGQLTDGQVRSPSLVPPWTRGHVITHVARAADSLCRLLEGARTGEEIPQYANMAARDAEIEAGAGRPVAALLDDVAASAARLDTAVRTLPEAAWQRRVRLRTGELRTPDSLLATRLRELEVHHADLAAGYTFADIPERLARWIIEDIAAAVSRRADAPSLRIEATEGSGLVVEVGPSPGSGGGGGGAAEDGSVEGGSGEGGSVGGSVAGGLVSGGSVVGGSVVGGGRVVVRGGPADLLGWLTGRSKDGAGLTSPGGGAVPVAPYWI
ncbi:maleylpyruvate isomerase family mycothiol-dependent enzyme [Streptomyces rhizoryzae]|uniref:maleylpyruvate isomerase family mycothiol-dependent enzyme n=1 Tax=Streptomyces rhizoryzae TaxID=2932493 RepID=UPI00249DE82A|nr:maleylpyruvate isomerase family mycothiol-dependent enzyme [Streptomyces rhizoryzae]